MAHAQGVITTKGLNLSEGEYVTNNHTKLLALCKGIDWLEWLEPKTPIVVCSDSMVSLGRVFLGHATNNVPKSILDRLEIVKERLTKLDVTWELHDGHPTEAELKAGIGKRGHTVSTWNVHVDNVCTQLAKKYKEQLRLQSRHLELLQ